MDTPEITGPVWIPTAPPSIETFLAPTLQPVPILPVLALLLAAAYLTGAVRLWVDGRRWPVGATLSFLLGCAVIVVVMGAGIEGYGYRLFSVFMFQQLTLMMAVPPLLVLGRPGTLLLRAMPHNAAGRAGFAIARWGLRSGAGRIALHPGLTIPLFLFCFYVIYLGGAASSLLGSWLGHVSLEIVFLVGGLLFTIPLLSTDPLPVRLGHAGRAIDLLLEMPLHAFFGVILMMATTPLVAVFAAPPGSWAVDPITDQSIAGALAWSYGELPGLLIALTIMVRWQRDDTRRAAAADREIDLHGDPALDAYNARLAQLHRGDGEPRGRP
ncbi:cytochrome c oxidase assembly protein [Cellulomonas fimi]|uniref:Cytochrome c oxidase assembly protein n=1 Tax=Cellulomonas fimi TaxID=1708 RepID=A0A7Y0LWJ5_CELFI|nr:cytochrome c oxidase assembly protein [Cellulomonas fimi]NMR19478.1 cytochrome c oxidase assembly protein [Cellulomonas fimi]